MGKSKVYSGFDTIPNKTVKGDIQQGCLVVEGGAFRGMYNQGVMDALLLNNINLQTVIGVSAGALAGINYVSGQVGRSARANLKYRFDSRFIGRKALQHCKSLLNLDFLFETYNEEEPYLMERLTDPERHFVAVATNCLNGQTEYYDVNNCKDIISAIKASATMPFIAPMVDVDGTPCMDGGCSCKLAYQWALDQGFEKIVVIRTREREYRKHVKGSHKAEVVYRKYPEFAKAVDSSNEVYNAQCDELIELEKSGRVFVLAPSEPVTVHRLERDIEKLGALYQLGYSDTEARIEELKKYLEG